MKTIAHKRNLGDGVSFYNAGLFTGHIQKVAYAFRACAIIFRGITAFGGGIAGDEVDLCKELRVTFSNLDVQPLCGII